MFSSILAFTLFIAIGHCLPQNSLESFFKQKNSDYGKIVGGYEVEPNSIPHQITFQAKSGFHMCGGSIINEDTVLTAAHCCDALSADRIKIVAGEHDLAKKSGDEQERFVSKAIKHENYGTAGTNNDVCILKLSEKLNFNKKVSAASLPKQEQEFTEDATASGWGDTLESGPQPTVLMAVDVKIVSNEECENSYPSLIDESMICAAAPGKDSCQGDSGGPMTCDKEKLHCGVVSWGIGCAQPGYPGVYARTSHFIEWINELA